MSLQLKKANFDKILGMGKNFAFIDSQNLNLGVKSLGWSLDYRKFRQYLRSKYEVKKAYLFIGQVPGNEALYTFLQECGFISIIILVYYVDLMIKVIL